MRTARKPKLRRVMPAGAGKAQRYLPENSETLKSLLALNADWRWELDRDCRFTSITVLHDRATTLFGADTCLGKSPWDINFEVQCEGGWDATGREVEAALP